MDLLKDKEVGKAIRPIKVVQFGEGNFLRGFVDYMIDIANEKECFDGDIVLVKPIQFGNLDFLHQQDCNYTVSLRGLVDGKEKVSNRVVTSVADAVDAYEEYEKYSNLAKLSSLRFVVSNTTEAGIVYDETDSFELNPPNSYPGKLTKFLYERFVHFDGDIQKGLIILPVELIDDNGIHLKEIVFKISKSWGLSKSFVTWLQEACIFCSTLVDRIVTGYPRDEAESMWDEFGYKDNLIVTAEPFGLWVIESEKDIENELPLRQAGLPVIYTDDQKPYKQRKVRILNGAHTSFTLISYLAGNNYVLESMNDPEIKEFMVRTIYDEIIPTLTLPKEDLLSFAETVVDRFQNPYIKHALLSISLNSVSKWKARCMPSLLVYIEQFHKLPLHLTFSLAGLLEFYFGCELKDGGYTGHRGEEEYKLLDETKVLEFFANHKEKDVQYFVTEFLSETSFWGQNLSEIPNLTETVIEYVTDIRNMGMREAIKKHQLV